MRDDTTIASPGSGPATDDPRLAPTPRVTGHFLYTDFVCPCCDRLRVIPALYRHIGLLERLRREAGFDIEVTSGYRCPEHNRRVGGVPRSWHLLFATDIAAADGDPERLDTLYSLAIDLGFNGIGRYDRHIHLDVRPRPARWRA